MTLVQHTNVTLSIAMAEDIQENHIVYTCVYPCTLVNFRWVIQCRNNTTAAAGHAKIRYFLIKVLQGQSPSTIAFANVAEGYSPGNNVLLAGYRSLVAVTNATELTWPDEQENSTDQYQMRVGDTLRIVMITRDEILQKFLGYVSFDIVT